MVSEFTSISELKKLLAVNSKIEKINPDVFASDAEVNIVTVTVHALMEKYKQFVLIGKNHMH